MTARSRLAVATVRGVPSTAVSYFAETGPREPAHFRTGDYVRGMLTHSLSDIDDVRWMPDTLEGLREWGSYR